MKKKKKKKKEKKFSLSVYITSPIHISIHILDHHALNLVLQGTDLSHQVTSLVGGDASSDHRTRDTSRAAQGELAGDEDVAGVLVLTQERDVEQNGERGGVGREDDQLGSTAIEGLGGCSKVR